jgi:hypothetical protein
MDNDRFVLPLYVRILNDRTRMVRLSRSEMLTVCSPCLLTNLLSAYVWPVKCGRVNFCCTRYHGDAKAHRARDICDASQSQAA